MKPHKIYKTLSPIVVVDMLCMIKHMLVVIKKFQQSALRTQKDIFVADVFSEVRGKWRREDLITMKEALLTVIHMSELFLPACEKAILDTDRANDDYEKLQKHYRQQT